MKRYHFISGLPRSGSTLLAAILRQNPYTQAGITSPVAEAMLALQQALSRQNEAAGLITEMQRAYMLRGVMDTYYALHQEVNIFDTNRRWCNQTPLLTSLFPEGKIICMVRDPRWIINSMEILRQRYPLELNKALGFQANTSIYERAQVLLAPTGLVGYALNAFRSAYYGSHNRDQLIIIDYDDLCREPARCIERIYQICDIPPFEHDFTHIRPLPEAERFDEETGLPGMHEVGRRVQPRNHVSRLPPNLWDSIVPAFW